MGQKCGELHAASMRRMRRVMKCMGMLPICQNLFAKVFCNVVLVITVGFSSCWRFSFDYDFDYDFLNDHFSSTIDLTNFGALVASHFIIVMELLWGNRSRDVDSQLQEIHFQMIAHLGTPVNTVRIRGYCNAIYGSLIIRWLIFCLMTVHNNRALTYYALYSEIVLMARFSEFTLYCAVILFLYHELVLGASNVVKELEKTRFELWSIRLLSLEKLPKLQRIHCSLWQSIRCLERYFQLSLITLLMKFFIDISALPYWLYLSKIQHTEVSIQHYVALDEVIKILEIVVPCYICTQCEAMQRKLRSMFYTITTDRRNGQLNAALRRLNLQLSQEKCQFSAGGLVDINTEMLGKFIFGTISYIVVCIQFSINLRASNSSKLASSSTPSAHI
ncbi:putative gustatory receptor 98a [Drosophila subpulchrella]|uniref:putative gustatory receptor 98a n=1 Tax=Drosophila subpulchrella TaxID=1486046 RepID=UPI0018A18AF2|nr:putative gustatory receptor 98a [Drosophila subpulchrella]